VQEKRRGYRTR
jgi:hypothetical protein